MNRILSAYVQQCYSLFYYRFFSNGIAVRNKDTILGSIYAKIMKWPEIVKIQDEKYTLMLPRTYAKILWNERSMWEKWYAGDFKGKTVLDIGAGAGETASFFFNRGAKKVIAFEVNHQAIDYLWRNANINNWNIAIFGRKFHYMDLDMPYCEGFDYLKMDIEGGEITLLNYEGELGPCSLELHPERIGDQNVKLLIKKFNLKPIMKPRIYGDV
jgi:SAM-dependent methyltransferase